MTAFDWPLDSNRIRRGAANHTFGMVRNGGKRAHQGWDFEAPIGTPCYAVAAGKIVAVRAGGDYGLTVVLAFDHAGRTLYAAYSHLASAAVALGNIVKLGQLIGTTGESGNAKGMARPDQHLHFELRTTPTPGRGLDGRMSPIKIFGLCPLKAVKRAGAAT